MLVLGGGPGGYTAAFRAADLGLSVVLVERHENLGGVCLNVGCIPSKALLNLADVIAETTKLRAHGIEFGTPKIDLTAIRASTDTSVTQLADGLAEMARKRGVEIMRGAGTLVDAHTVSVAGQSVNFDHAILATGSRPASLGNSAPQDQRIMDSTDALRLEEIPRRLLVIGGGIVGLELATVYEAFGSQVTVVELSPQLVPGCDRDLVAPLERRIRERYAGLHLETRVVGVEPTDDGLHVSFAHTDEDRDAPEAAGFDRLLVAIGRVPNSDGIGLEHAGVRVDAGGFVEVDSQLRTSASHILAVGDLAGPPLLAHKATHEAKIAAEIIAGMDVEFDAHVIPSVAFTNPELAWVGLTEAEATRLEVPTRTVRFPWAASGRALATHASDGVTKLVIEEGTNRLLGAGVTGVNTSEIVSSMALALELETDALDVALTVFPHLTFGETVGLAAEVAEGTVTDLMNSAR